MIKYFIRRILWIIPVFLGVTLITSTFMHLLPGSPFTSDKLSPDAQQRILAAYGLDKPIWEQYIIYVFNFVRGDWGISLSQQMGRPVSTIIAEHIGYSLQVAVIAISTVIIVGVPFGIIAALNHNKWLDYLATGVSLFFYSIPSFVLGILTLILILWSNNTFGWTTKLTNTNPTFVDLLIPGIVLGIRPASIVTRLTRASMLEVLGQDYIRTAGAKGLSRRMIITRHALKNSLIPIVTVLGDEFGGLAVGSVTIETVFAIPGIGFYLVSSIESRDYSMILITTALYAMIVVVVNLVVDLLYGFIDPRIKYSTRKVG
ncbi:ABC transporter permease [Candidatus Chlorohelix sp.]|uniref:ABC transporter permease n=1 Tax=Candidatus Chlorohelix sp. TaxID=3139201 RepID=UPI0030663410